MMSGIYGTSSQVQIDTHFVPSFLSQLQATQDVSFGLAGPVLPDTQSVLYLVDIPQNATPALDVASAEATTPHLLRAAMPQASSAWQLSLGNEPPLPANAQSFAPSVRKVEFWYFDGTQWLTSWDMIVMKGLPIAMQILLWVDADDDSQLEPPAQLRSEISSNSEGSENLGHVFSLVVSFPVTQVPGGGSTAVTNSGGTGASTATDSNGGSLGDDGASDGDRSAISDLLDGDQSSDDTPADPSRQGGGR
ncbi:MAG: hypothetical protein O2931_07710 [Planctomycetota bacterium]|nr:hypothetical protein [Planctomycetota bacterium]